MSDTNTILDRRTTNLTEFADDATMTVYYTPDTGAADETLTGTVICRYGDDKVMLDVDDRRVIVNAANKHDFDSVRDFDTNDAIGRFMFAEHPEAETDADDDTDGNMKATIRSLTEGDTVTAAFEAGGGDLLDDGQWTESLRYVGEQSLSAQSRKESHEFENADGKTVYLRWTARHENNFGFVVSHEGDVVEADAMWQDVFTDDREWVVVGVQSD